MKNKVMNFFLVLLLVVQPLIVLSLNDNEKKFVGKWKNLEKKTTIEFKDDGTMTLYNKKGKVVNSGKWKADSEKIYFDIKLNKKDVSITSKYEKKADDKYLIKPEKVTINKKEVEPKEKKMTIEKIK